MNNLTDIASELPDSELVFAFVSPLGTPLDVVQSALFSALAEHKYYPGALVRISELLGESGAVTQGERPEQRQERLMDEGNALRNEWGDDHLALLAISAVKADRERVKGDTGDLNDPLIFGTANDTSEDSEEVREELLFA